MGIRQTRQAKFRVLLITCLPILCIGLILTTLLAGLMQQQLSQQSQKFGQTTTDQMASAVVDHLVNEDLLSLSLLVRNAILNNHCNFVSVYNVDNLLLAQAGRNHPNNRIFTDEVTVQNVVLGYVEVGFNGSLINARVVDFIVVSIILHCLGLLLVAAMGWRFGDLIYLWIMQPDQQDASAASMKIKADAAGVLETTILVAKFSPTGILPAYKHIFAPAVALHAGEIVHTEDNLIVHFRQSEQMLQSIMAAQLLIYLAELLPPDTHINIGLHQAANKDERLMATKQSSYLAANSKNKILTSRTVKEGFKYTDEFYLAPYYSAMTPDGEVFQVQPRGDQSLLTQQAAGLIKGI